MADPSSMSPSFGFLWLIRVAWEASQLSQIPLVLTYQEELGQPQTWANSNFHRTDSAAEPRRKATALASAAQPPIPLFHCPSVPAHPPKAFIRVQIPWEPSALLKSSSGAGVHIQQNETGH